MQRFTRPLPLLLFVWISTLFSGLSCGNASGQAPPSLSQQLLAEGATSLAQAARERGDSVRGAILFPQKKLNCVLCHRQGATDLLGPDLTLIGKDVGDEHFVESILQPSKVIRKRFESIQALTVDGRVVTGRIVKDDDDLIVLRDTSPTSRLIKLPRAKIEQILPSKKSAMPDGLADQLTGRQQFLDLVKYVMDIAATGQGASPSPSMHLVDGGKVDGGKVVEIPIPDGLAMEAGSFEVMPDDRLAIGTRRGDIFLVNGAFDKNPQPRYDRFASGLDEVLGMSYKDDAFYITQQTEVTRITDTNHDGHADRFETLSDVWGFRNYHEFAFGSKLDRNGNIWVALCLSKSYHSDAPFRGWCLKVTPEGKTIPICSGIRSPCGIGPNEHGVMFYAESQGPWNGSCSLKVLEPGGFMGHPISFNWYELAGNLGEKPVQPNTRSRLMTERRRIKELVPYAVVFPYIKMGRSISGFMVDRTGGKFGPFENQIFVGDFSLSLVMRATTEKVNGVWQGACYPFREGLATGLLACQFTPRGDLIVGGTNRGWPVRGPREFAIQRLDWTGKIPFEIKEINARPDGFLVTFTKPVDRELAAHPESYSLTTYTHVYQQGYGSPEVDHTTPRVTESIVSASGLQVQLKIEGLVQGHVHDFNLASMRATGGGKLVHTKAYYTLNEIPEN